jgi:integrase
LRALTHNVFSVASTPGGPWGGRPNPVVGVPRARVDPKPKKILEPHEWERVLAEVPEQWRGAVAVALYAGLREGEVFGMLKEDVDLAAGRMMVGRSWDAPRPKGGKTLPVPIAPSLVSHLATALRSPGPLLFPQEDGSMQPRNLRLVRMLQAAVARAGVLDGYEHRCRAWRCGWRERRPTADVPDACPRCGKAATYAMPVPRRVNFHGLRHSFGTAVVRSSGLALGQRLLRHSDPRLTANVYAHLDDRDTLAALAAIQAQVDAGRIPLVAPEANTAPALRGSRPTKTKPAAPSVSGAVLRASGVGATGFEPATTCTPIPNSRSVNRWRPSQALANAA